MSTSDHDKVAEFVGVIRSMIHHEDELLNQRLTWMWTLQGLLFGAATIMWSVDWRGVVILSIVGFLSCISIGYSLARGLKAIKELLRIAAEHKSRLGEGIEIPPTIGSRSKAVEWLLPGYLLPWVFGLAWVVLVSVRLAQPAMGR